MTEKKETLLHANVVNLGEFRKKREEQKHAEEDLIDINVVCCSACGNNTFMIGLHNEAVKYDKQLICSTCFEPIDDEALDTLGEIMCGVEFMEDFDFD